MKMYVTALSSLVFALTGTLAAPQTQRALLIGINTYQPAGTQRNIRPDASMDAANWGALRIWMARSTMRRQWRTC